MVSKLKRKIGLLFLRVQVLNSRVTGVEAGSVQVVDRDGNETNLPFGACVWATGVAMNPLVKSLQSSLEGQTHFRALLTDDKLRVLGGDGSIWAIGDASTIAAPKALDYADELFELADEDKNGTLSLSELAVLSSFFPSSFVASFSSTLPSIVFIVASLCYGRAYCSGVQHLDTPQPLRSSSSPRGNGGDLRNS
jgi:hypothetical protein